MVQQPSLVIRFKTMMYQEKGMQKGKPLDRQTTASHIFDALIMGSDVSRDIAEEMLEKTYGQKMNASGKELYFPLIETIIDAWDTMGSELQKGFGKERSKLINELRAKNQGVERM